MWGSWENSLLGPRGGRRPLVRSDHCSEQCGWRGVAGLYILSFAAWGCHFLISLGWNQQGCAEAQRLSQLGSGEEQEEKEKRKKPSRRLPYHGIAGSPWTLGSPFINPKQNNGMTDSAARTNPWPANLEMGATLQDSPGSMEGEREPVGHAVGLILIFTQDTVYILERGCPALVGLGDLQPHHFSCRCWEHIL